MRVSTSEYSHYTSKLKRAVDDAMESAVAIHDTVEQARETVHDEVEAWIQMYQDYFEGGP